MARLELRQGSRHRRARCACSRTSTPASKAATCHRRGHRRHGPDVDAISRTSCARGRRSLRTACLLSKPSRRKVDVHVDYIGFTIEDRFVVGYGLDYAGAVSQPARTSRCCDEDPAEGAIDPMTIRCGSTSSPKPTRGSSTSARRGAGAGRPRDAAGAGHAARAARDGRAAGSSDPSLPSDLAPAADIRASRSAAITPASR